MVIIMKNKKGWIEIIEAVVSILLVATVLLITVSKGYIGKSDISETVYKTELSILREVETGEAFRIEITNTPADQLPLEWEDFPVDLKDKIIARTPTYLNCIGKICKLCEEEDKTPEGACDPNKPTTPCNLQETIEQDIYSQSIIISTTLTGSTPVYRRLKLFCWEK